MSKRFVSEKRDPYYRRAKEVGYRARSAFKLLQVHDVFDVLGARARRVVDLCAAPGSWSQVLAARLVDGGGAGGGAGGAGGDGAAIVAVDLQAMAPIAGVVMVQGDITSRATAAAITAAFRGAPADVVVCDGAPDVTGLHDVDEALQWQLLVSAANIAAHVLARGGAFVAKIFTGAKTPLLVTALRGLWADVQVFKPLSSRPGSREAFVVARDFAPPRGWAPDWDAPALANGAAPPGGDATPLVRMLAMGDLARGGTRDAAAGALAEGGCCGGGGDGGGGGGDQGDGDDNLDAGDGASDAGSVRSDVLAIERELLA